MELLKPLYEEFDKTHFAQLCARLAQCKYCHVPISSFSPLSSTNVLFSLSPSVASEKKDPLSIRVFEEAGRVLAQHILALLPKTVSVVIGNVYSH